MLIGEWVPDFLKAERVEVFEVGQWAELTNRSVHILCVYGNEDHFH